LDSDDPSHPTRFAELSPPSDSTPLSDSSGFLNPAISWTTNDIEPGRGVTILCVDNEPDDLTYLKLTFEEAGYNVLLTHNGDEALERASESIPDMICLDLLMPGSDGFDVMRRLRANPILATVPVVVLSVTSEGAASLAAGACRYLTKPASADMLIETVREVLGASVNGDVLVIEDDPDTAHLHRSILEENGFSVRVASDGRQGMERMLEHSPAAVVLDLMMPVMDGFSFLSQIGKDPVWRETPVIVLSAKSLDPHEASALAQSCSAILAKGAEDAEGLVDALLRAVLPQRRRRKVLVS
jgi:CheY-like chemotaxis protein